MKMGARTKNPHDSVPVQIPEDETIWLRIISKPNRKPQNRKSQQKNPLKENVPKRIQP